MITAELIDNYDGRVSCYNPECPHNLKYHDKVLSTYYIKRDALVLRIWMSGAFYAHSEIYCRDCIDIVYRQLKPILNSSLWPFQ